MKKRIFHPQLRFYFITLICVVVLLAPVGVMASPIQPTQGQGNWWDVTPEDENPSSNYDSILYSEIAPLLRQIEVNSNRVKVDVIGQSAGGRNLFLVTLSDPQAMGRLGKYQAIRQTMLTDPEKAQEMIDKFGDFKVPVFINGSIHGGEYPGVDAAIRLIEKLAFEDSEEVQLILENVILLVNVVQNPDGRVMGTRGNANGFDLNRDFITQSQPETRATVKVFTEWNPMVVLDLHGFVNPMLIEPCTPPHNPNYEYDLYIKWALDQAEAMEAELLAQTGFNALIPFRDWDESWDDWPPIFTPMYAMYHGAYGHTLETPYRDERGVDAHFAAVWGALNFVSENRVEMIRDQIEIFRRGFMDEPQVPIPDDILDQTPYEQYNELTTIEFPAAYVIPAEGPLQQSPFEAARLVDFLLYNDVQVEQADQGFTLNGVDYPKGSYVVWMNQPKRGLANTILWDGWDISFDPGLTMYDISGWSHPLLWGVTRAVMEDWLPVSTHTVQKADVLQGSVEGGGAGAYAYLPVNNAAIKATTDLLSRGVTLYRSEQAFTDGDREFGAGTFILPAGQDNAVAIANELANQYGLEVFALSNQPAGATLLREQRAAVLADEGVAFILKQYGFNYDLVTRNDLNSGIDLSGYDVFINSGSRTLWNRLTPNGQATLSGFFAGGGDFIGIGVSGAHLAYNAELVDISYASGSSSSNGVLNVVYDSADPIAAQYPADGHGFVYGPLWFTDYEAGVQVSAFAGSGDFFVSGYWPGWDTSGAEGQAIILHATHDLTDVTLMGIDPTFRAHPEHTFRILANAIFNGLE